MNHLQLIIKREYLNKIRNKSFILMTFLSPLIMVGIFALVAYLSQLNNDRTHIISVLDESGYFDNYFEDRENVKFQMVSENSLSEAKTNVENSESYGLLYIPSATNIDEYSNSIIFYSVDSPSLIVMSSIEETIEKRINVLKFQKEGIDVSRIDMYHPQ